MFLNETKPPLDEALEHFGVRGMHWGQRRAQKAAYKAQTKAYKQMEKDLNNQDHEGRKRKIAIGVLAVAGTAATIAVLHNSGHLKIPTNTIGNLTANGKAEQRRARKFAGARDAYKKSNFANRTFTPPNVGNPLFTVHPKSPKTVKDFVDAGFGNNGVFNVTTMARASSTMSNFDNSLWSTPALAITSGRK